MKHFIYRKFTLNYKDTQFYFLNYVYYYLKTYCDFNLSVYFLFSNNDYVCEIVASNYKRFHEMFRNHGFLFASVR